MIIYYIIVLPLWVFTTKVFQFSLWNQLVLILVLLLSATVLKYLETEGHLNRSTSFLYNLHPLQMFVYNLLRLEELSRENVFLAFTLLTLSFWFIWHGWIHPGINLTCALSFCIYFVGISYSRLRWNLLNDTYLNLYKGKDSFEWKDVILGMQTRVGNIHNKLNNSVSFRHIPRRQSSKAAAEKIIENAEVQKYLAIGVAAAVTSIGAEAVEHSGADTLRNVLASPQKQEALAAMKELDRTKALEAEALTKNTSYQNPITDEGRIGRGILEKESTLAIQNRAHAQELYNQAQQNLNESLSNANTSSSISNLMDHVNPF